MQVYLNGSFVDHAKAAVPVDDRGFLFADGVYEVIRAYHGRPFLAGPHMQRMRDGLTALRIDGTVVAELENVITRLIELNGIIEGIVYLQVTRGAAPRRHAFPPAGTKPTVYAFAKPFTQHDEAFFTKGVAAVTVPDTRWSRCDIKSISLLPNVLANQYAHENDAFEALFIRDGILLEGSHSNLFAVLDNRLITYPASNYILAGITRSLVLDLARDLDIDAAEVPLPWERLGDVTELFLSGTTTEIMPITRVDGRTIGDGRPGPTTRRLRAAYRERVETPAGVGAGAS
jgi:D-alanine transaminase